MQSTQITLHNVRRSPALSARIRELSERLEQHHSEIVHCRVSVTQEANGSRKGRLFTIAVRVRVPGRELVVSQQNEDVYGALRDAFDAMRRELVEAAAAARAGKRPHSTPIVEVQS